MGGVVAVGTTRLVDVWPHPTSSAASSDKIKTHSILRTS
jgi:hypothetical protein